MNIELTPKTRGAGVCLAVITSGREIGRVEWNTPGLEGRYFATLNVNADAGWFCDLAMGWGATPEEAIADAFKATRAHAEKFLAALGLLEYEVMDSEGSTWAEEDVLADTQPAQEKPE